MLVHWRDGIPTRVVLLLERAAGPERVQVQNELFCSWGAKWDSLEEELLVSKTALNNDWASSEYMLMMIVLTRGAGEGGWGQAGSKDKSGCKILLDYLQACHCPPSTPS